MKYSIPIKEKVVHGIATLRISQRNATPVCRAINRKKFSEAKALLEKLDKKKTSLKGKYYSKSVKEILKFLKQIETSAKAQNIDSGDLFLFISSRRGPTMQRARRRWGKFGTRMKISHVQAVLGEKDGFGKKVRERGNKE